MDLSLNLRAVISASAWCVGMDGRRVPAVEVHAELTLRR